MKGLVTINNPFKVISLSLSQVKGKDKLLATIEVDGNQIKTYCFARKVIAALKPEKTYKLSRDTDGQFTAVEVN